uniref:RIMS binding protein 2 n=1 Tax=Sinocyclocheilus anshuiensis TaxID=1608454 RepID=A0A671KCT1_9TELE
MREAADRRQQLEAEHEQALAFLNSRQQEINLLQKVRTSVNLKHACTHTYGCFVNYSHCMSQGLIFIYLTDCKFEGHIKTVL